MNECSPLTVLSVGPTIETQAEALRPRVLGIADATDRRARHLLVPPSCPQHLIEVEMPVKLKRQIPSRVKAQDLPIDDCASGDDKIVGAAGTTQHTTFCRICEPLCGLIVSVTDRQVTDIKGDKDNPVSRGFVCPKGVSMQHIQHDPDRVTTPLRRVGGPGEFEECSWDEAMRDIASRTKRIIKTYGPSSIGGYLGNPGGMHSGHMYWFAGFLDALGSPHAYSAGSQDTNTRLAASAYLYGTPLLVPFPDAKRTDFMLMFGANPLLSKGSLWTAGRVREQLSDVVRRGGRVVVVDPRRTETAKAFEHLPIRADTDGWLLAALLGEAFRQGWEDGQSIEALTTGSDRLREMCVPVSAEVAAEHTGVPADDIRRLARDFAMAPSAVVYTRTGVCTGTFGTLVNFFADALNVITGNLDHPGGSCFGDPPVSIVELGERFGMVDASGQATRVGGLPRIANFSPSVVMPHEITTPGEGQLRALIVGAGNVALSTPGAGDVEESLRSLDLLVCLDLYITETSKYADYILPGTTFLERADMPVSNLQWAATPFVQATQRVVEPPGQCREEYLFYQDLTRRIGLRDGPFTLSWLRWLALMTLIRPTPMQVVDLLVRISPQGDLFGLRRNGLNMKKILAHPHGLVLGDAIRTGIAHDKIGHPDRKVHLGHEEMESEMRRLLQSPPLNPRYPIKIIGRRELRSHNSWMHNVPNNHTMSPLLINPGDAEARGLANADRARVFSEDGEVVVEVEVTDDVVAGTVVLPHGWGHAGGGWSHANAKPGVNYNVLTSTRIETAERISGMSHLNGVAVQVERVRPTRASNSTAEERA